MSLRTHGAVVIFCLLISGSALAEEIRDYYTEPGLNPFKQEMLDLNEGIDPFSGALQLKYRDLHIPGNGGMDISINRFYTHRQENAPLGARSYTGLGWTMHFGRIVVPTAHRHKLCTQTLWSVHTQDNPSIEFPDGGREMLVLSDFHTDETLITKNNWKADCQGVTQGMRVTAPDGKIYYMDVAEYTQDQYSWYTSRIEDLDGNWIEIHYQQNATGIQYIDSVTSSDGRIVEFGYQDIDAYTIRLASIAANGQVWQYNYAPVPGSGTGHQYLTQVVRPDGLAWDYTYYPQQAFGQGGSFSIASVTYPHGARIDYTYQLVRFDSNSTIETTAIASKSVSGAGLTPGVWSYQFNPAAGVGVEDQTIVTTPNGRIQYLHQGYLTGGSVVWPVGLLIQQVTYEASNPDTPVDVITNYWGSRKISDENYWHGRDSGRMDNETNAPILTRVIHWRDGSALETSYENYDQYGNPGRIVEECNLTDCPDKVTTRTYLDDLSLWMIGLPLDETIEGIGSISRTYDPNTGRISSLNRFGVATSYTYTPDGDLETQTDARGYVKRYGDYFRGLPQLEEIEVSPGVTIATSRVVNPAGTVHSRTDGRGYTATYSYDGLNRLVGIVFPIHDPVSIVYGEDSKVLTRGAYQERSVLNGFGDPIRVERVDLSTNETIVMESQYDALGHIVFSTYPNVSVGVTTTFDVLGRKRSVTQGDGSSRSIDFDTYLSGVDTYLGNARVVDERGHATYTLNLEYGRFGNSMGVVNILTELNATVITRNQIGQITTVTQGGFDIATGLITDTSKRYYYYDSKTFLDHKSDPEIGTTWYGRDEVGNVVTSRVGTSLTTFYSYDGIGRMAAIDYPNDTPDIQYEYDDNSNVTGLFKGVTEWRYGYDENNNLIDETLSIAGDFGQTFSLGYSVNGLDVVEAMLYPGNSVVEYAPDAFGRPTKVGAYVSGISYHASGQTAKMVYGNGVETVIGINDRQFVESITTTRDGDADIATLSYAYDGVGNVTSIADMVVPANSLQLAYDAINRLTVADGSWGNGAISYNALGDITSYSIGNRTLAYNYLTGYRRLSSVTDSSASVSYGYTYDVYGNVTKNHLRSFRYDDASQLVEVIGAASGKDNSVYAYDGNGNRVLESRVGEKKYEVYSRAGVLVFERSLKTCQDTAYAHAGMAVVAKDTSGNVEDLDGNGISDCMELDLDEDGLSAAEEAAKGTDPANPDSDGDGLPDGYEVSNGIDPLVSDAGDDKDSDGVSNYQEYVQGTDPSNSNSFQNNPPKAKGDFAVLDLNIDASPMRKEGEFQWRQEKSNPVPIENAKAYRKTIRSYADGTAVVFAALNTGGMSAQYVTEDLDSVGSPISITTQSVDAIHSVRLKNGDVAVIWDGGGWAGESGARLIGPGASPVGGIIDFSNGVGTYKSDVAVLNNGEFVVAWLTKDISPKASHIYVRRYTEQGVPIGQPIEIVSRAGYTIVGPALQATKDGGFALSWVSSGSVFLQWFDRNGVTIESASQIDCTNVCGSAQGTPTISELPSGNLVVAWAGNAYGVTDELQTEIYMALYDAYRRMIKAPEIINTETFGAQRNVAVSEDIDGFNVFWGWGVIPSTYDAEETHYRKFDRSGYPVTEELTLSKNFADNSNVTLDRQHDDSLSMMLGYYGDMLIMGRAWVGQGLTLDVLANDTDPDPSDDPTKFTLTDVRIVDGGGVVSIENNKLRFNVDPTQASMLAGESRLVALEYTVIDDSGAESRGAISIEVKKSHTVYLDDFEQDTGWSVNPEGTDTGSYGVWAIGNPSGETGVLVTQLDDVVSGTNAWVTGLPSWVPLRNGNSTLLSPVIALPDAETITGLTWYYGACSNGSWSDSVRFRLRTSAGTVELFFDYCALAEDGTGYDEAATWKPLWLDLSAYRGQIIQVEVLAVSGSYGFEAAIDDFRILAYGLSLSGDVTAPVVSAPADLTVEADAVQTVVALGTASANDETDGVLTVTPDQSGPFPVGTHTVTWSATDGAGNVGTATQTVIVQDTTAPVLTVPADVNVTAVAPATVAIGVATATDIFSVSISNDAPVSYPSATVFPAGTTVVTWTATDANGNASTATQNVTVTEPVDVIPPVVSAPANITVEADAVQTVVALGTASANDETDGVLTVTPDQSGPMSLL